MEKAAHQTKRTDFGGKGRRSTDFTARGPQVDDFDFGGVLCEDGLVERRTRGLDVLTNFGAMSRGRQVWDVRGVWVGG